MSGGYFDYKQYQINEIVDGLKDALINYDFKDSGENLDIDDIIFIKNLMEYSIRTLKEQSVIIQRLDWFLSGDDGFESFKRRLHEELDKIKLI